MMTQTEAEKDPKVLCPVCHHPWYLHQTQGCQIRLIESGQESFSTAPICGCMFHVQGQSYG